TERAYKLFRLPQRGPAAGRLVTLFANQLAAAAKGYREDAHRLLSRLEQHADALGLDPSAGTGRLATACRSADLLDALTGSSGGIDLIELLAIGALAAAGISVHGQEEIAKLVDGRRR